MKAGELISLYNGNLENLFSVHTDSNGYYYYNLMERIVLPELPSSYFQSYTVKYEDMWPTIAYQVYGDIRLWWLITLANNITNPTQLPEPGTTIKVFTVDAARTIISQL